jgi:hypothetical protein
VAARRSTVPVRDLPTRAESAVAATLIAAGVILRLWQYLANSSLWIDEAALARNIIERPFSELFGSLHYAQVAPPLFLAVERGAITVFGTSEYALRLFPLLSGIVALVLFWAVAWRTIPGWPAVFAVGLFALAIPFVYSASQVKQYSSDAAVSLSLLLAALTLRAGNARDGFIVLVAAAGAILVWMSQTALFVIAGITIAFVSLLRREPSSAQLRLLAPCCIWLISGVLAGLHGLGTVTAADREYFRAFWHVGFLPFPPAGMRDVLWLPEQFVWVFGSFGTGLGQLQGGLKYRWSYAFTAVMVYGWWRLWRTRRDAALLLGLPVLATLGASALGLYPFTARLVAFLIPSLLICVAAGAGQLVERLSGRLGLGVPVVLAILGGSPLYAIATALPPSRIQDLKPALVHLAQQRRDADAIYVYSGAALSYRYYAGRLALPEDRVHYGTCAIGNPRDYLKQLDRLRGEARVWVVMTHEQQLGEREFILGYLNQLGRQLDVVDIPSERNHPTERASVHLYDLSEPRANVEASTVPVPPPLQNPPSILLKWGCYGITGGEPTL